MPIPEVTAGEAQALLASDEPPRLIDVREADEWEICRLPGAELVPLSRFNSVAQTTLTDPAEPLIIYCHHGGRSGQVTEHLLAQGFLSVKNLAGGIDAWSREIDPSVPRY